MSFVSQTSKLNEVAKLLKLPNCTQKLVYLITILLENKLFWQT